jgi:N-acetylmuramoyl-L-alanine amidase
MPEDHRPDDDSEFEQWARKQEDKPPDIPASVTFMEMMRQAAARAAASIQPEPRDQETPAEAQDETPSRPRRTTSPPAVRRVRRRARRARTAVSMIGGLLRTFIIVIVAAGLMATIFTWWTPNEFISDRARQGLSIAMETQAVTAVPTTLPTPNWARRIGVVAGHRGNDSGAVCDDGLNEASINLSVAELIVRDLRGLGYTVDLLDEFDPRLNDFQASALVSIHSNTCRDFGERVSGFIVAASAGRITSRIQDDQLVSCIAQHYATTTRLERRIETTIDMTDYHTFREINVLTPAAIIEIGFMRADRELLTDHPDMIARGITDGVLCFLEPGQRSP